MAEEHTAKIRGLELPISRKVSVEICNFIKHKNLNKAKAQLQKVLEKKLAVPYKKYKKDTPHRRGKIAAGRYPIKTAQQFIKLLNSLQVNAENKGLNPENLVISFASACQGPKTWHYGRKRRRKMKRTHIELRVKEQEPKETKKEVKKVEKKEGLKEKILGPKKEEKPKEIKQETKAPETVEG